jgi:hypothetical protein
LMFDPGRRAPCVRTHGGTECGSLPCRGYQQYPRKRVEQRLSCEKPCVVCHGLCPACSRAGAAGTRCAMWEGGQGCNTCMWSRHCPFGMPLVTCWPTYGQLSAACGSLSAMHVGVAATHCIPARHQEVACCKTLNILCCVWFCAVTPLPTTRPWVNSNSNATTIITTSPAWPSLSQKL